MEKKSCSHCGIENTGLWRTGPSDKPVLCNACGTRWRIRGTLDNYIPKHGITHMDIPPAKPNVDNSPLRFKVSKRKRSVVPQYCLTGVGRLHQQLLQIQYEDQSTGKTWDEEGNNSLIQNENWMASCDENGLGAMLLK